MANKLDDIFNECYERIRSGESLESCLRSYPRYRADLEPLLRTTFDIGRRVSYIHPRPEFKHWAQVRFESAMRYPRQQQQQQQQRRTEAPVASGLFRHAWAVAFTIALVLILGTGSTMAASSQALPDQTLYPVKLATEQIQVAFAVTDQRKAEVYTELVGKRADEVEAMANEGKTEEAAKAAALYDEQFQKAIDAIIKAEAPQLPVVPPIPPIQPSSPAATTPPAVTTPTETTTPASTTTTPAVTTPTETTTSTGTTTTPEVTTPTETTTSTGTTTPPTVVTTSENVTPSETATPEPPEVQPPVPTEQPTGTGEEPATTTEEPSQATEQPTTTEEEPATTTTKQDYEKSTRAEKWKNSLENSRNKSLQALQDAKDKASHDNKASWQKTIDSVSKSNPKTITNKTDTSGQSGSTSQTTVKSDNNTAPGTDSSSRNKPSSSNRRGSRR